MIFQPQSQVARGFLKAPFLANPEQLELLGSRGIQKHPVETPDRLDQQSEPQGFVICQTCRNNPNPDDVSGW
jgi:hypothetical protein